MKIHIELLNKDGKVLTERHYTIESARLNDLSQVVDSMLKTSKSILIKEVNEIERLK